MIEPCSLISSLASVGIDFYVGVPDSLLKDICAYIDDNCASSNSIIAANEGSAVAIACGYHLATGRTALVYLQNSGLGNAINPLTSIADAQVFRIPMLLLIGWRGEPGARDEPQHIKQGRITVDQLKLLEIPYQVINADDDPESIASWASAQLSSTGAPVALVVRRGAFATYHYQRKQPPHVQLLRESALDVLLDLATGASIVSTTGKTSREIYELRIARNELQHEFLTLGGMGHASSIALGAAIGNPSKKVVCIDGDGAALMHLGALPIIGNLKPASFVHVLLNNASHESVGGQPTVAGCIDIRSIALACGYTAYACAYTLDEIRAGWSVLADETGPVMLEIRIKTGSRNNLGRPNNAPADIKNAFMQWMSS